MALKIQGIGKTDVGLKRTNNEDAFVLRPDLGFWAVADGMGGAAAGEVASRIFVETATEAFASNSTEETQMDRVKNAFTLANRRMLDHVALHPDHAPGREDHIERKLCVDTTHHTPCHSVHQQGIQLGRQANDWYERRIVNIQEPRRSGLPKTNSLGDRRRLRQATGQTTRTSQYFASALIR